MVATAVAAAVAQLGRGEDVDTASGGEPRPSSKATNSKPRISRFTGDQVEVRVEAWLNAYEVATYDFSENDRKFQLVRYLDGSAITWFSEEIIPQLDSLKWSQVRDLMIKRHGRQHISPIVAATSRKLQINETVQSYYDDKMRYLRQTTLTEKDQAAILTEGLPKYIQKSFVPARISNPVDWLTVALDIEALFGPSGLNAPKLNSAQGAVREHPSQQKQRSIQVYATTAKASGSGNKPKKVPPKPYRICEEKGIRDAMHWHADCPNKTQRQIVSETGPTATIRHQSLMAHQGNGASGQS